MARKPKTPTLKNPQAVALVKATLDCQCSHCLYLWEAAYDRKGEISYDGLRDSLQRLVEKWVARRSKK